MSTTSKNHLALVKSDPPDSLEELIQEVDRLAAGRLEAPVRSPVGRSGSYARLAQGLEIIRQSMIHKESELQVTGAQLESVQGPLREAVGWAEHMAGALTKLMAGLSEIETMLRKLHVTIANGERSLTASNQSFQEAASASEKLSQVSQETSLRLENLQKSVVGLDAVLEHVNKSSGQVKLISFNVAIEAARGGDAGRTFNVIAQEMRKLAEQSSSGIKETHAVTGQVKQELTALISDTGRRQQDINNGLAGALVDARSSFSLLQHDIEEVFSDFNLLEEQLGYYAREINSQLQLWKKAAQSLRTTSEFLEEVQHSLAGALQGQDSVTSRYEINRPLVDRILEQLISLAASPEIAGLDPVHHKEALQALMAVNPEMEAIYSNQGDGAFIFSLPPAALVSARARQWWQEAMQGRAYCSEVYVSAITRQPCLTLAVPIKGKDGRTAGVLAADLRMS